ncbi:hypothetical protein [Allomeiothermus silvanus]|nr:hypothetical protein [Allomeiothermus silvanus]
MPSPFALESGVGLLPHPLALSEYWATSQALNPDTRWADSSRFLPAAQR